MFIDSTVPAEIQIRLGTSEHIYLAQLIPDGPGWVLVEPLAGQRTLPAWMPKRLRLEQQVFQRAGSIYHLKHPPYELS